MNNRRILAVQESDNYTAWAPSASVGYNAFLSDKLNQSSLSSALPHFTLFDKSNNESSTPDNFYGNSYGSAHFNPFVAMTVVLVSAFFSLGVYFIFVCRCACREHTGWNSRRRGGGNGTMNRASQGLDRRIIETFPMLNYSLVKGLKQGKQALECAVCLSEFEDDEKLRLLPKCSHAFHPDCIDMWLFSHTTCPLCRSSLVPESRIVEQGIRVNVESQTQQDPLHAAEQVAVVVGEANAVQDIADHQDGSRNEMHPFDAGAGLNRTRPGQPSVYNEGRAPATNSSIVGLGNDLRLLENRGQNFPRSHSTGHSLVGVGRNPEHPC